MKTTIFTVLTLAFLGLSTTYAQVGIGTATPHASAMLDVESTDNGFLPPRMTTGERDAINGGVFEEGLTIYNTTVNCLQWWNGTEWFDPCAGPSPSPWPASTVFCASGPTEIVEVTNTVTNKTWMDRNLGASKAAGSSTDADSYGDLYQWGRAADGHQCRTSPLHGGGTLGLASTSAPNTGAAWDGRFITVNSSPDDWLNPQDNFLWNTNSPTNANDPSPGKGATDPCPTGYRVPTEAELEAERASWTQAPITSSNNSSGAIASPLKLPAAGFRMRTTGSIDGVGADGVYWSSTVSSNSVVVNGARDLFLGSSNANMSTGFRASGYSVRCIKD